MTTASSVRYDNVPGHSNPYRRTAVQTAAPARARSPTAPPIMASAYRDAKEEREKREAQPHNTRVRTAAGPPSPGGTVA